MYQQKIKGKTISSPKAILLIVGIVVLLTVLSLGSELFSRMTGHNYGSYVVWLAVGGAAVWVMRSTIMEYRYTLAQGTLYLERMFGEHAKILAAIPMCDVRDIGAEADMHSPKPPVERATLKDYALPVRAILYTKDGASHMALFQPDAELIRRIEQQSGIQA